MLLLYTRLFQQPRSDSVLEKGTPPAPVTPVPTEESDDGSDAPNSPAASTLHHHLREVQANYYLERRLFF